MCAILIRLCTCIALLVISISSLAAIEVHEFDNDVDRLRYQSFINEMRCPKCTNQNLAGTPSPIAEDLRRELVFMIKDGRSDKEIVDFMVERYGEFILYRPRLSAATILLWAAPFVLLISGVVLLLLIVRKRRSLEVEIEADGDVGLSFAEKARLASLLKPSSDKESSEKANKKSKQEKK